MSLQNNTLNIINDFINSKPTPEWIIKESGLPWLELNLNAPKEEMLKEIESLKTELILNCSNVSKDSSAYRCREEYKEKLKVDKADNKWKFLTLYGISSNVVEDAFNYNELKNKNLSYSWTEAGNKCPIHKEFLEKHFNFGNDFYVKYAVLEPGGFTSPHSDSGCYKVGDLDYNPGSELYALTFMIKNPTGNVFYFHNFGQLPIREGKGFLLNVDYFHCTLNKSNEFRYHLMIINTNRQNKSLLDLFKDKTLIQEAWQNSFANFKN